MKKEGSRQHRFTIPEVREGILKYQHQWADHLLNDHLGRAKGKPSTTCHRCNNIRNGISMGEDLIAQIQREQG